MGVDDDFRFGSFVGRSIQGQLIISCDGVNHDNPEDYQRILKLVNALWGAFVDGNCDRGFLLGSDERIGELIQQLTEIFQAN